MDVDGSEMGLGVLVGQDVGMPMTAVAVVAMERHAEVGWWEGRWYGEDGLREEGPRKRLRRLIVESLRDCLGCVCLHPCPEVWVGAPDTLLSPDVG